MVQVITSNQIMHRTLLTSLAAISWYAEAAKAACCMLLGVELHLKPDAAGDFHTQQHATGSVNCFYTPGMCPGALSSKSVLRV
jgi:hypothetical protein